MVTKKQRRKQIAQANAQRRESRQLQHEARGRQIRLIATGLAVALAVVALVVWIVMHDPDSDTTRAARGDYDAASVDRTQPLNIEVPR